MTINNKTKE